MDHREAFSLYSADLGILRDGVGFQPCAGGEMDGKIYFGTTKHSYLKENRWQSLRGIYYFAIPVSAERFALLYKGLEVAHGVIRK